MEAKSFKKRQRWVKFKKTSSRLKYYIFNSKCFRFEFAHLKIIKSLFKHFLKNKYTLFNKFIVEFNLLPNYPVSLKVKNSRMGKGVGYFLRWVFFLPRFTKILNFLICIGFRLNYFTKLFKCRISSCLFLGVNP